jgi:rRNA maturation endonuclease Nob1
MAKYIKKCCKCNKIFEQQVEPKKFEVSDFCEDCNKQLKNKLKKIKFIS